MGDSTITVEQVIDCLSGMSKDNLARVAHSIGLLIHNDIRKSVSNDILSGKRHLVMDANYDTFYDKDENSVVKGFLEGASNLRHTSDDQILRDKRHLAICLESLYSSVNVKYLSAAAIAENLTMYSFSGSKKCVQIMGKSRGAGSNTTLMSFINELASVDPPFPRGDVICTVDNTQLSVVGRNYTISFNSKQPCSVICAWTVMKNPFIELNLQQQEVSRFFNIPGKNEAEVKNCLDGYNTFWTSSNELHAQYRLKFMKARFNKVSIEYSENSGTIEDHISRNSECGEPKTGTGLLYDIVPACESKHIIYDQEIIPVNPASRGDIEEVLKVIIQKHRASDSRRKWILMYSDAVPYLTGSSIIQDTFACPICNIYVQKHLVKNHCLTHNEENLKTRDFKRPYYDIVLRPGGGHFIINLTRAIFAIYFDIFLAPVAELSGHVTEASKSYIKSAVDLHKSTQLLQVVFEALSDEIFFSYFSEHNSHNRMDDGTEVEQPSFDNFIQWHNTNTNPNYLMTVTFLFNVLHPLFLMRASLRQCNNETFLAAREKASLLFFGFFHPQYRKVTAMDIFYLLTLQEPFKSFIGMNSTRKHDLNYPEVEHVGESFDFLQENRNFVLKGWCPYGIPTTEQWIRTSKSLGALEHIKKTTCRNIKIDLNKSDVTPLDFRELVFHTRKFFRENFNLHSNSSAFHCPGDTNTKISSSILNIIPMCEENRKKYYTCFLKGEKADLPKIPIPKIHKLNPDKQEDAIKKYKRSLERKIHSLPKTIKLGFRARLIMDLTMEQCIDMDDEIMDYFLKLEAILGTHNE